MLIKLLSLLLFIHLINAFNCNDKYITLLGYIYAHKYLTNYSCKLISIFKVQDLKNDNLKSTNVDFTLIDKIQDNKLFLTAKQLSNKLSNNFLYYNQKPKLINSYLMFVPNNNNNKNNILSIILFSNIIKIIVDMNALNFINNNAWTKKLKYVEFLSLDEFNKKDNINDTFVSYF
jgi:hypothetical protein